MKRIIFPLLLMLFTLTGCSFDNTSIINREKIVIGFDESFAPMGFRNKEGEIVGFDIDLAKEAARRLGVAVEFKPIDWAKKREEITSGNVDMLWNGCDITPERKEYMIFSKPYMDDRQIVLVKRDDDFDIHSEYDLEGKVVGTQAGSSSDDYINQNEDLKRGIKEYKTYGKFSEAVTALKNDEIEVIVCDELIARYEMNSNPNQLRIIEVRIGTIAETGIGFRKDNVALRDKIQKTFDEMIDDGTAKKISEKWFHADLIKRKG